MCKFKTVINTFKNKKGYTVTSVQTDFVGNQCITVYVNTNGNVIQYNLLNEGGYVLGECFVNGLFNVNGNFKFKTQKEVIKYILQNN